LKFIGLEIDYMMKPIIGDVISGGSADVAGLKQNDVILKIENTRINYANQIGAEISSIPDTNVFIDVLRNNEIKSLPVNIGRYTNNEGVDIGMLGVTFGTKRTLTQSISKGVYETYNLSVKTLQFIGKMLTGNMGTENLSGPIGIAQMAGNTAQAGFLPFMYLMALLSISLAVLNLLPIPVLDGGQLTLLGIEALRGKPLPEKAENVIYTGGAVIVGALMIFAIFNDVSRFL
jgi:regulator of sigma E protease